MAQQYSSILLWICLFVTCCNVRGQPNDTTTDAVVSTVSSTPAAITVSSTPGSVVGGGSSSAATPAVPNPGSGTGATGSSASSTKSSSGSTTPAAKGNCSAGTTTTGWSGAKNVSGSCQSSTCWVLATYAGDEVTQIKLSCAPKEQSTTCDKDDCKYASGSCECCCSADSCNYENFDKKCEGARASSKGVRLSPPWLGLVALVLVVMKMM